MDKQQCPNCSAPMIVIDNRDGSYCYKCEYCGSRIDVKSQTVSSRVFALANRIVDSFSDKTIPEPTKTKVKKSLSERMDEINRATKALGQRGKRFIDKIDQL
jgi:DNA-directed RNA polymerase subunit M/transcription elongation factor TFIIS